MTTGEFVKRLTELVEEYYLDLPDGESHYAAGSEVSAKLYRRGTSRSHNLTLNTNGVEVDGYDLDLKTMREKL